MRFRRIKASTEHAADVVDDISWLYDKYSASMYRLAMFITRSADDAEDAVADVFAKLSEKRSALRPDLDPKPYLLAAVRNASYSIMRGKKRCVELSDSMLHYLSQAEYDSGIEAHLDAEEILKPLALLPAEQREIVVLKALEQLTFNEIAKLTGSSINTVASRYRSAITSLRKSLEAE